MATSSRVSHRRRGRDVPARRSRRTALTLGLVGLLALAVVIVAVIVGMGSNEATLTEVAVATKAEVPNAEPRGRAWGPVDAPIKVEEFVDYQCPACGSYALQIESEVIAAFAATGKVRYEVHNFPFQGTDSLNAAEGAYCAAEQDTFWPFHSSIFMNQPRGHGRPGSYSDVQLVAIASGLQMDTGAFESCLASNKYEKQAQTDYNTAVSRGIQSTPTFVINGEPHPGIQTVEDFRRIFAAVAPEVDLTQ
jgi:protein-disulfide isomerase